jgi:hypothetical protein
MTRLVRLALVVAGATATLGCGSRLHMAENYARATRTVFARQVVNPGGAAKSPAVKGLDAQEAGAVVETYRKQLAPKDTESADRPMLILAPRSSSSGAYMPPPSVPAR